MVNNDLVDFTSAARYEHVGLKNHVNVTTNGGVGTINHDLGYIPFFRLFVKYPDRSFYQPVVFGPVEPDGYFNYQTYVNTIDATKIEIGILNNTLDPQTVVPVYYRIYEEPQ